MVGPTQNEGITITFVRHGRSRSDDEGRMEGGYSDAGWNEMSKGALDGLTFAEAEQRFPRPFFRGPFERVAGTGESEYDLNSRISLALQRVIRRGPGRYLVVSHGGSINAALRLMANAPLPVNGAGIWFHLGHLGYVVTRYRPANHTWVLQELQPGEN